MRNDPRAEQSILLTGQFSVSVYDWEVHLAIISKDIRDVAALIALDGQHVQVMLSRPTLSDQ